MNQDMTRRGWLAGVFATLAGAVSKLFGRSPAPVESGVDSTSTQAWLVCTRRDTSGSFRSTYRRLDNKVTIELGTADGEFIITAYDRCGRVVEQRKEVLHNLFVYPERNWSAPVVCRYDAVGSKDPLGQITTYVYDSTGRQPRNPQDGSEHSV